MTSDDAAGADDHRRDEGAGEPAPVVRIGVPERGVPRLHVDGVRRRARHGRCVGAAPRDAGARPVCARNGEAAAATLSDPLARAIAHQLFRSAWSVAANYRVTKHARSHADFATKMCLAAEESEESAMWLEALRDLSLMGPDAFRELHGEADEFVASRCRSRRPGATPAHGTDASSSRPRNSLFLFSLFPIPYFSRPHPTNRAPLRWRPSKSLLQSHQRSERKTAAI